MMPPPALRFRAAAAGFLLLETMVGVAVFAIGVLTLARCMQFCLDAETARLLDGRACAALENRMAEVEAGAVLVPEVAEAEKLTGTYDGITLRQWTTAVELENENREEITGIEQVHLEATWDAPGGPQSRSLEFYVFNP